MGRINLALRCNLCGTYGQDPNLFGDCECGASNWVDDSPPPPPRPRPALRLVSPLQRSPGARPAPSRSPAAPRPPPPAPGPPRGQVGAEVLTAEDRAWLKATEARMRDALRQGKATSVRLTPNAALITFTGSASLTVDQIHRQRSELLTTHRLPIVAVQPEPGAITVAVARPKRRVVRFQDVWERWGRATSNGTGNNDLLIGVREADGELLVLSPGSQHAPHTLIAGATGSGKSVLMQNIILCIAATNTVQQAEIVLIDPKLGVDYFELEELPHLRDAVISDQPAALERMRELVHEMNDRYRKFKAAKARTLADYNLKAAVGDRLPTIWLIHDEFAEWMLADDYKNEVTAIVSRLGVKARAAGIYLVFAAQRPEANVMPMQLRDNLGNRLILRVASKGTSEIALGTRGAEDLLDKGHLLARLGGETGLLYAQVPYVDPDTMVAFVRQIAPPGTPRFPRPPRAPRPPPEDAVRQAPEVGALRPPAEPLDDRAGRGGAPDFSRPFLGHAARTWGAPEVQGYLAELRAKDVHPQSVKGWHDAFVEVRQQILEAEPAAVVDTADGDEDEDEGGEPPAGGSRLLH